jgi:hypothetical protein
MALTPYCSGGGGGVRCTRLVNVKATGRNRVIVTSGSSGSIRFQWGESLGAFKLKYTQGYTWRTICVRMGTLWVSFRSALGQL